MIKACAAVLVLLTACATVQPKRVLDCTIAEIRKQSGALFAEVMANLASQDYVALLANLAVRVGRDVVICAVQEVQMRMKATPGADAATIQEHAAEYLRTQKS